MPSPFSRKRSRTASPAPRTRKPNRLQRLWQKATSSTANKALYGSLVAIVGTIAALFLTSRGSLAPSWNIFQNMVSKIPGVGKKIVWLVQKLLDLFMSAIGVGLKIGDVVKFRAQDRTIVEGKTLQSESSDKKDNSEIKVSGLASTDLKGEEKKFILKTVPPGSEKVTLCKYEAANAPSKGKELKNHLKNAAKEKNLITYEMVYAGINNGQKDKAFPFNRMDIEKCDSDDQLEKKD